TVLVGLLLATVHRVRDKAIGWAIGTAFTHHGPKGALAKSAPAGLMVMWTIILLLVYLVIYLFV
ncbi:MAG: hypothetical protein OEX17_08810, partial [Rhodospirillaceae bacterium]|nr:hypothetical protein [Rhodospirillaceae bacterium]